MRRESLKVRIRAKARMGTKIKAKRRKMVRKGRPTRMKNPKGRKIPKLVVVSFVMIPIEVGIVPNV